MAAALGCAPGHRAVLRPRLARGAPLLLLWQGQGGRIARPWQRGSGAAPLLGHHKRRGCWRQVRRGRLSASTGVGGCCEAGRGASSSLAGLQPHAAEQQALDQLEPKRQHLLGERGEAAEGGGLRGRWPAAERTSGMGQRPWGRLKGRKPLAVLGHAHASQPKGGDTRREAKGSPLLRAPRQRLSRLGPLTAAAWSPA